MKPTYRKEHCPKCSSANSFMEYRPGPITIKERGRRGRRAGRPNSLRLINGYFICHKCTSMYYTVTLKKFDTKDIHVEEKHKWEVTNTITE